MIADNKEKYRCGALVHTLVLTFSSAEFRGGKSVTLLNTKTDYNN